MYWKVILKLKYNFVYNKKLLTLKKEKYQSYVLFRTIKHYLLSPNLKKVLSYRNDNPIHYFFIDVHWYFQTNTQIWLLSWKTSK